MAKVTKHAKMRAKHRGVARRADGAKHTITNAYSLGLTREEATGAVQSYIDGIYAKTRSQYHNNCPVIRLYGEHVYIFSGKTLITVYQFPDEIREEALAQCRVKRERRQQKHMEFVNERKAYQKSIGYLGGVTIDTY